MEKDSANNLLSVIVPVYRVEQYLDRCVESIVGQTYPNLEIILVDDGSPDNCPAMCDGWAEKDSRIRVIHKPNGGLSSARNAGIDAAAGRYLAFVDSDDYIGPNMYETMISAMERTGAGIACCGRYIVRGGIQRPMHCMDRETVFSPAEAIKELLLCGCVEESACDKVYERQLFRDLRFPVGEINEDIVIMPRLLDRSRKIVHVGKPFYYYWQEGASITRSSCSSKKRIILDHLDGIEQFLQTVHPELLPYFAALQARYCQSILYLLLDNPRVRQEYQADYREFYARFRESFPQYVKLAPVERAEIIKGYLIYWKLYYHLHLLKKRGGQKRSGSGQK